MRALTLSAAAAAFAASAAVVASASLPLPASATVVASASLPLPASASAATSAASLPLPALRGWNSWDSYLGATDEATTLQIAAYMNSTLLPFGFNLVTIDEGWYYTSGDPAGSNVDAYGRYMPLPSLYPSSAGGKGFAPLSATLAGMGLKLGVWTLRGIPVAAAAAKLPIYNSAFTADQAVRMDRNCSWQDHSLGCAPRNPDGSGGCNDAALAYYASLAQWYKEMGVFLAKVDCMFPGSASQQGLYDDDDHAMTAAFVAAGVTISLSPGAFVSVENGTWVAQTGSARQYRITQDLWDQWTDNPSGYPTGLRSKLDKVLEFASLFGANNTNPDPDMLPLGRVNSGAHPPLVPSNLTSDEQRLLVTLWCAVGAPLVLGARLPFDPTIPADALALELITNAEVLAVQNASVGRLPLTPSPSGSQTYAWSSTPTDPSIPTPSAYISLYNGDDAEHTPAVELAQAGLPADTPLCARDLWAHASLPGTFTSTFSARLAPHSAGMWLVGPCGS
jgi:alpha-galactosidase